MLEFGEARLTCRCDPDSPFAEGLRGICSRAYCVLASAPRRVLWPGLHEAACYVCQVILRDYRTRTDDIAG